MARSFLRIFQLRAQGDDQVALGLDLLLELTLLLLVFVNRRRYAIRATELVGALDLVVLQPLYLLLGRGDLRSDAQDLIGIPLVDLQRALLQLRLFLGGLILVVRAALGCLGGAG